MIGPDPTDALAIRLHMCLLNQLTGWPVKRGNSIKLFGSQSLNGTHVFVVNNSDWPSREGALRLLSTSIQRLRFA
jgi:hypothetical protein